MLDKILSARSCLSPAERKVADQVLDDPELCVGASIQRLAQLAGVSDPTVLRFCRAIGCKGYHDFKIRMAQSIASQDKFFFRDVSAGDTTRELTAKLVDSAMASMQNIQNQLNHEAMETAIDLYCGADRVEFYGSGGSALVAQDAQLKFFRLGKPAISYADPHLQKASAVLLDKKSLAIAISYSGRNREVIDAMLIARRSGSPVVTVTRTGSPLERLADINLNVEVSEDSDVFSPLKSRLAQMVVMDIFAVGVALRGGDKMIDRLTRAKVAIADNFVEV